MSTELLFNTVEFSLRKFRCVLEIQIPTRRPEKNVVAVFSGIQIEAGRHNIPGDFVDWADVS